MAKLELYLPVKPKFINQPFGATYNVEYYHANGINIIGHNGIDLFATHGQPVYASHDGVAYYETDSNQGNGIVLLTNQTYDYNNGQCYFKTIYWHLIDNQLYPQGTPVKAGDILGYADSTGLSTGDHLHWGLKPVANNEPAFSWVNLEQDNGYLGAIDPTPYLNGLFAEDIVKTGYTFNNNMTMNDQSEDIRQLQLKLQRLGLFPSTKVPTGFYGPITRTAVFSFQQKYIQLNFLEKTVFKGMYCGPKTRSALNAIQGN